MSFYVSNPTGKGGFGDRPHDIWHVRRQRGEPVFRCSALSKRSGVRCKFAAIKGSKNNKTGRGFCYWHGGTGGDNRKSMMTTTLVSLRRISNRTIKRARTAAQAEVDLRWAAGELREAYEAAKPFFGRIHPADEGRLVLAHEARLSGLMTNAGWREMLRTLELGETKTKSASTSSTSTSEIDGSTLTPELTALDWRKRASNDDLA